MSWMMVLVACSEYGLENGPAGSELVEHGPSVEADGNRPGTSDDGPGGNQADDGVGLDGSGSDGVDDLGWTDPDEIPDGELPDEFISDCDSGTLAAFSTDELVVFAQGTTGASGTLTAPEAGWFHVYDTHIAESGPSQRNESAFYRIPNATNPTGIPATANCGDDWIVLDADNQGPAPGTSIYLGTFWLDAGDNELQMHHYCPLYLAGECDWMHETSDPGSTCPSGNVNSVHFSGFGLCLEAVD